MPFSYQLYSSRNHGPLPDTLKMLADLGYDGVEGFGGLLTDVPALKAALDAAGLPMPTSHVGLDMIEGDPEGVVELAGTLGIGTVFCPFLPPDQRPDDAAGWRDFGARLEAAGRPLRDAGLEFGWHNHDFEFRPLPGGVRPIDAMFEGGPHLKWEADVAWIVRGGADPIAEIARYADRIVAVHVKDIAPEGEAADEDGWADVGHGTVDWTRIMTALRERTPAEQFVMEHDKPSDDRRFAERSITAARTL